MKPTITALAILAVLGAAGLAATNVVTVARAGGSVVQPAAQEQTRIFAIANMTCALCPITVRKAMESVRGVKAVKIDFAAKTATVVFDSVTASPQAIAQASANAGYPAKLAAQGG